jgi:exosortase/archaeosortase family protein
MQPQSTWTLNPPGPTALRVRHLLGTVAWMVLFYAVLYHPYAPNSAAGRALIWYLTQVARLSAWGLRVAGEPTSVTGTTVHGRFPFVVVLDCAALDAQALLAAAMLAFPARARDRALGIAAGLSILFAANIARLVLLYFAALHSLSLFHVLHEEVLVFAMIAVACGTFLTWAIWAHPRGAAHAP